MAMPLDSVGRRASILVELHRCGSGAQSFPEKDLAPMTNGCRDGAQKESPKPIVTLTSSLEKPTSARKTAVRSKLTRSPTP